MIVRGCPKTIRPMEPRCGILEVAGDRAVMNADETIFILAINGQSYYQFIKIYSRRAHARGTDWSGLSAGWLPVGRLSGLADGLSTGLLIGPATGVTRRYAGWLAGLVFGQHAGLTVLGLVIGRFDGCLAG